MLKNAKIWFVVADGSRARIVAHTAGERAFETIVELESPDAHLATRDLGTDKPTRAFGSADGTRHAIEPRSDFHDKAKLEFADIVADKISDGAKNGLFQLFALIAPPKIIHEVKKHLSTEVSKHLAAELPKDLTKLPQGVLQERLLELPLRAHVL